MPVFLLISVCEGKIISLEVEAGTLVYFRNMMLQNEATDANEDLEHFEDIPDHDDNQAGNNSIIVQDNKNNKGNAADASSESDDDIDTPLNISDSASSDSEGDDGLLGADGFDKLEESKPTSNEEKHNIQSRTVPGGYDPRHREPSYR